MCDDGGQTLAQLLVRHLFLLQPQKHCPQEMPRNRCRAGGSLPASHKGGGAGATPSSEPGTLRAGVCSPLSPHLHHLAAFVCNLAGPKSGSALWKGGEAARRRGRSAQIPVSRGC
ncbi:hypothetical protein NDU88_000905 [Pleurodeles waltl]|uniref:Uncharacterized protein n=1 Tax=Pleurodeles waltl TaxID=8319 RepID=A0AAV7L7Y0_PLEWA|nr:hypothetical protein NDU88_000905 [Pleurodeles waltl]